MLLNKAREHVALDKLWLLDNAILTHQPNTQSDADKMSESIRVKQEELVTTVKLARGIISEEQLKEKMDLEDGVMREIK